MKQTGELLRNSREEANLSISEVALSTKINPKILAAIEAGDTTNLPAKPFLKGFLRSYALFLKMDPDDVMKVYYAEVRGPIPAADTVATSESAPSSDEPVRHTNEIPSPTPKRRIDEVEGFKGLRVMAVAVIVVLIGVIIGVRELIEKYQREKIVDTTLEIKVNPLPESGVKVSAEKTKSAPPAATPAPAPAPASTSKPLVQLPDTSEVKTAEVKDDEAQKEVLKKEEPKKEEPKKEDVKPVAEVKPEPPAEVKPNSILKSVKNEIILEALDKVDVKFRIHGDAKIVSLGPTQVHTIFANEPMVIDLSDGGAVNIILNGRERGVPGDLGKPKQVKIP